MTVAAQGASLAQAIGLRTMLASRAPFVTSAGTRTLMRAASWASSIPWNVDYAFIVDNYHQMLAFPEFWDAALCRAHLDTYIGTIGTANLVPPAIVELADYTPCPEAWASHQPSGEWTVGGKAGYTRGYGPPLDGAGLLALILKITYDRGDHAAFTAHKTAIKAALDNLPRSGGLVVGRGPPGDQLGWDKEDGLGMFGQYGMASVLTTVGYRALATMATAEGDTALATAATTAADAMKTALAGLRRTAAPFAGFYNATDAAGSDPIPHIPLTCWMVINDLCGSSAERDASSRAIVDAYNAGEISRYGWVKHLPGEFRWAVAGVMQQPGTYTNGGYWSGEFVLWALQAMQVSGAYGAAAVSQLAQENIVELLRQERFTSPWKQAPYECLDIYPPEDEWGDPVPSSVHQSYYAEAAGHLSELSDPLADLTVTLDATNGYAATITVPYGHRVLTADMSCGAVGTYTVGVYGTPYNPSTNPTTFGTYFTLGAEVATPNLTASLASETSKTGVRASRFAGCWGGRLSVRVTAGAAPGPVTVTLRQSAPVLFKPGIISAGSPTPPTHMPPGYVLEAWDGSGNPPIPVVSGDESIAWSRLAVHPVWRLWNASTGQIAAIGPAGSWPSVAAFSVSPPVVAVSSATLSGERLADTSVTVNGAATTEPSATTWEYAASLVAGPNVFTVSDGTESIQTTVTSGTVRTIAAAGSAVVSARRTASASGGAVLSTSVPRTAQGNAHVAASPTRQTSAAAIVAVPGYAAFAQSAAIIQGDVAVALQAGAYILDDAGPVLKRWNGSTWERVELKSWNGMAFNPVPLRRS